MSRTFLLIALAAVAIDTSLGAQQATPKSVPEPRPVASGGATPANAVPRLLPGAKAGILSSIQGSALNSTNGAMPDTLMRLRNARLGRIVGTTITDKSGLFTFSGVEPGSYVVEMMGPANDAVVAATPIIDVGAGQSASTVLKLPFRIPPFGGVLGHTVPSAIAVSSAAAAAGVLAGSVAGAPATNRSLPGQ